MAKIPRLKISNFEIFWLDGGAFQLDGGCVFGVVPKVLWEKKYQPISGNNILMYASPILIRDGKKNILIDTGLGNKLTEKQIKIYGVMKEWNIHKSLEMVKVSADEIDYVILTHCDYDHSGGLVQQKNNQLQLTFPNAQIVLQKKEWEDVKNPNRRAKHTFWDINFVGIEESGKLQIVDGYCKIYEEVFVEYTGGHNRGHQIVKLVDKEQTLYHLGDILPSNAHFNPLWVMAYDSYPLDVIELKERYLKEIVENKGWVLFYHDPKYCACKFDEKGNILEKLEREVLE